MENNLIYNHYNVQNFKNVEDIQSIINRSDKINEIFFTNYSADRNEILKSCIMEVIKLIDKNLHNSNILNKKEISFLYFVKSLCLDKLPEYTKQAEESATKSLKLNPFNSDNYNCIAHIIWKKGESEAAISYFKSALEIDPNNKTSLRCLSMIVRSKPFTEEEEKKEAAKLSIDYAKKAVMIDLRDAESWCKCDIILDVYGNAYFNQAFAGTQQYEDLKFSLNSYNKAERNMTNHKNPDLFYNRAVVEAYLENYLEAHNDFLTAHEIDVTLKSDLCAENICSLVMSIFSSIKKKCSLKEKKLSQILNTIPVNLKKTINFTLVNVDKLNEGANEKNLISAKVIQHPNKTFEVPMSLICSDAYSNFFCLSIYNVSKNFLDSIKIYTSNIVVIHPVYKIIKFKYEGKTYEYPCIQVHNLNTLFIDGQGCTSYSSSSMSNSTFFN